MKKSKHIDFSMKCLEVPEEYSIVINKEDYDYLMSVNKKIDKKLMDSIYKNSPYLRKYIDLINEEE